jgi:hypothetical protein
VKYLWTVLLASMALLQVIAPGPARAATAHPSAARAGQRLYIELQINGPGEVRATVSERPGATLRRTLTRCGADDFVCTADILVPEGWHVTLVPIPVPGGRLVSWGGAPCSPELWCSPDVNQYSSITANFTPLRLSVDVAGSGSVVSTPMGLACTTACSADFDAGSTVMLTAIPADGVAFRGWEGITCYSSPSCVFTMDGRRSVYAVFSDAPPQGITVGSTVGRINVSVVKAGTTEGTVSSSDGTIVCGAGCPSSTWRFSFGRNITFIARGSGNWRFDHWSWQCGTHTRLAECTIPAGPVTQLRAVFVRITKGA